MPEQAAVNFLEMEIERSGDTAVVRCSGKLVAGVSESLYARVKSLIPDTKRIVLDLKEVTRMDSMGLGALVRLYVSAKSAGCRLELMHLSKQVRELLGLTNLMSVFVFIGECGVKMG